MSEDTQACLVWECKVPSLLREVKKALVSSVTSQTSKEISLCTKKSPESDPVGRGCWKQVSSGEYKDN